MTRRDRRIAMLQEIKALRERVAKLNSWLNEHESMLAKSRRETNDARREQRRLTDRARGMWIPRTL